jgi:hypothetical protein
VADYAYGVGGGRWDGVTFGSPMMDGKMGWTSVR